MTDDRDTRTKQIGAVTITAPGWWWRLQDQIDYHERQAHHGPRSTEHKQAARAARRELLQLLAELRAAGRGTP